MSATKFGRDRPRRLLRQLKFEIHRTLRSANAAAVHDLRVVLRRLSQAIAVYKLTKSRRRLKKVMDAAGRVRNLDVVLEFVAKWRAPEAVRLQSKIESEREELSRILVHELKRHADGQMLRKWQDVFAAAPVTVGDTAQRTLGRLGKSFLKAGKEVASPKTSAKDLHRFRIAAKKLRYTLELFPPLDGSSLNSGLASIKRVHRLLGGINDCATAAALVAEYRGGHRLAGRLKEKQHKKTEEFDDYWGEELRGGKQLQTWLDRFAA